eukprot:TRINITY_DN18551_c0_g3_i1.p1 TRINITY_DN18551_c0_g3~~TRINITY_DN18551_c0_g3_i1.p1  ORF type:complete len:893 (-),score=201.52 TRINITY_DN18551_c0_g3_i1:151-2829(-)
MFRWPSRASKDNASGRRSSTASSSRDLESCGSSSHERDLVEYTAPQKTRWFSRWRLRCRFRGWFGLLLILSLVLIVVEAAELLLSEQPYVAGYSALVLVRKLLCVAVFAGPVACCVILFAWTRLQLPGRDGTAGMKIVSTLTWLLWVNLVLVVALCFAGYIPLILAALVYLPLGTVRAIRCVCRSLTMPGPRRFIQTWAVFLPLIFEYKLLAWWVAYSGITLQARSAAYASLHAKYAPRVYELLVDLGGVFVKIGQLVAMLPGGVLPEVFGRELRKLQNAVPPRPGEEARALVAEAMGCPLDQIFSHFADTPIGSASIGQVHRARLRSDGREVVVKIQYPEVSRTIEPDFDNCELVARLLVPERLQEVRDTKKHYIRELDFISEAQTLQRVHDNMRNSFPKVLVPEPVMELCRPTILVMSFLPGVPLLDGIMHMAEVIAKARGQTVEEMIKDFTKKPDAQNAEAEVAEVAAPAAPKKEEPPKRLFASTRLYRAKTAVMAAVPNTAKVQLLQRFVALSSSTQNLAATLYNNSAGRLGATRMDYKRSLPRFDPFELSHTLWKVHGHQVLVDGLFSTDPHPGNILLSGSDAQLGLIDFGQVCDMDKNTRLNFSRLLLALAEDDDIEIARCHAALGATTKRNSIELLALSARFKFGDLGVCGVQSMSDASAVFNRYKKLQAEDPIKLAPAYEAVSRAERLINILRGTSFILGVSTSHNPVTVWVDTARAVIRDHVSSLPPSPCWLAEYRAEPGPEPEPSEMLSADESDLEACFLETQSVASCSPATKSRQLSEYWQDAVSDHEDAGQPAEAANRPLSKKRSSCDVRVEAGMLQLARQCSDVTPWQDAENEAGSLLGVRGPSYGNLAAMDWQDAMSEAEALASAAAGAKSSQRLQAP